MPKKCRRFRLSCEKTREGFSQHPKKNALLRGDKCGQDARDKDRTKCPCTTNADLRHFEIADVGQVSDVRAKQGADGPADKSDDPCRKSRPPGKENTAEKGGQPGNKERRPYPHSDHRP